jgi:hypothetical protein
MKNLFLKQGVFRESETEKSFLKDFNLNKWIKKILDFFHVPHVDDCCDAPPAVPMRYDLNASKIQAYNTNTKTWFDLPASAIGRAVFKGNIQVAFGTVFSDTIIENTLQAGCSGSFTNPTYSATGNMLSVIFSNNCNPDPFTDPNIIVSFYQISGTPKVANVQPVVVNSTTTIGFVLYDSTGNTINYSDVSLNLYIQISIPIL